jgi:hypothetical protein
MPISVPYSEQSAPVEKYLLELAGTREFYASWGLIASIAINIFEFLRNLCAELHGAAAMTERSCCSLRSF